MKKNHQPYVKWYSSDFLAGVRGLSATQIGIYTILINEMYERCEPLPINNKRLAWQCGCTQVTFKKTLEMLIEEGKIIIIDDCLWNNRVEKEFENRKKRSVTGTDNANAGWKKRNKINGAQMQTVCKSDATAMLIPETRNQNHKEVKDIDKSILKNNDLLDENHPEKKLNGKKKTNTKNKGTRYEIEFKDDIGIPQRFKVIAQKKGLEFERIPIEWEKFGEHFRSKDCKKPCRLDWPATWRYWVGNAIEWGNNRTSNSNGSKQSSGDASIDGVMLAINGPGDFE